MDVQLTEQQKQEAYAKNLALVQAQADLNSKVKEVTASKGYGKAYVMSVLFPPMGLFYFVKYLFFDGSDQAIKAGIISLVLTLASLLISILSLAALFNQATSGMPQGNLQMLQDLANPKKQQEILQLYK